MFQFCPKLVGIVKFSAESHGTMPEPKAFEIRLLAVSGSDGPVSERQMQEESHSLVWPFPFFFRESPIAFRRS